MKRSAGRLAAVALAIAAVSTSRARGDATAPTSSASADSRYDQLWPLAAGWGAWAHGDRIDVGPRDGAKRTLAKHTIRWGTLLDSDGARAVFDGGCGAPGSTAKEPELCVLEANRPPRSLSLPATASKRDYARGALLLADGRLLVTNGLHLALVHADGTSWEQDVMPVLRSSKLVEDCRERFDAGLHCGQFVFRCEAGWKVSKPLARGATGTPELELSFCKGGEGCYFDTVRLLAILVAPARDAVVWKRLNPPPPIEHGLEEILRGKRH